MENFALKCMGFDFFSTPSLIDSTNRHSRTTRHLVKSNHVTCCCVVVVIVSDQFPTETATHYTGKMFTPLISFTYDTYTTFYYIYTIYLPTQSHMRRYTRGTNIEQYSLSLLLLITLVRGCLSVCLSVDIGISDSWWNHKGVGDDGGIRLCVRIKQQYWPNVEAISRIRLMG